MSVTAHVIRQLSRTQAECASYSASTSFQPIKTSNKSKNWNKNESEREREGAYLLTEDQLVIKEEEDSLLAASIRLIDPWQLPSVDELRAPVQDIIPLDKNTEKQLRNEKKKDTFATVKISLLIRGRPRFPSACENTYIMSSVALKDQIKNVCLLISGSKTKYPINLNYGESIY